MNTSTLSLATLSLVTVPAFDDNYLWLLHDGTHALVVDPGDAAPIEATLSRLGLKLTTILVTHHHSDHVGGVDRLRDTTGAKVYGPAFETIPEPLQRVSQGDALTPLGVAFEVLEVPGHTSGHIAYFHSGSQTGGQPLLFCGDTLFSAGCGRLFEGTPAQMLASLQTLCGLPDNTLICCAHEYTLSNLQFAMAVDGQNQDLQNYNAHCHNLRKKDLPTIPTRLGIEKKINPFLRSHTEEVILSVRGYDPAAQSPTEVFAALRQWKNQFKST